MVLTSPLPASWGFPCAFSLTETIARVSRKRKTRCNGARPNCNVCLKKTTPCHWPEDVAPGGYKYVFIGDSRSDTPAPTTASQTRSVHVDSSVQNFDLPPISLRHRLLRIFTLTHHALELCGCIHMDMFNDEALTAENKFVFYSILALSSLHLTDAETRLDTPFSSSKRLMRHFRSKAQAESRHFSDNPTGSSIPSKAASLVV